MHGTLAPSFPYSTHFNRENMTCVFTGLCGQSRRGTAWLEQPRGVALCLHADLHTDLFSLTPSSLCAAVCGVSLYMRSANRPFPLPSPPPRSALPELKRFMDKQIKLTLIGETRVISGTLRGFDQFLNITLVDAKSEPKSESDSVPASAIGTGTVMVRGASVKAFECLEPVK